MVLLTRRIPTKQPPTLQLGVSDDGSLQQQADQLPTHSYLGNPTSQQANWIERTYESCGLMHPYLPNRNTGSDGPDGFYK